MTQETNSFVIGEVKDPRLKLSSGYLLFELECHIELSNKKYSYNRRAYTILDLLGDFGGFNDAILMICGVFMKYYSKTLFKATISQEFDQAADPDPANLDRLRNMHQELKNG